MTALYGIAALFLVVVLSGLLLKRQAKKLGASEVKAALNKKHIDVLEGQVIAAQEKPTTTATLVKRVRDGI